MTVTTPRPVRSPLPVRIASVLLVLLAAVSSFGMIMFSFVWVDEISLGAVFAVLGVAAALTAVAAVPSLLRGELLGWLVAFVWACAYSYWSLYKVFVEEEGTAVAFLLVGLVVAGLLATASARRHAGVRR